ncbi:hypothetical protein ACLB2K_035910 [Fragaria x ananassa]
MVIDQEEFVQCCWTLFRFCVLHCYVRASPPIFGEISNPVRGEHQPRRDAVTSAQPKLVACVSNAGLIDAPGREVTRTNELQPKEDACVMTTGMVARLVQGRRRPGALVVGVAQGRGSA